MKRIVACFVASLVVARGASSCSPGSGAPGARAAVRPPPRHRRSTRAFIVGPGRVEPVSEEIAISAELPGRLSAVLVDEGQRVGARGR